MSALGIGLTDLCKTVAGTDDKVGHEHYDVPQFEDNVRHYRPRTIAFTSKKAASIWLGKSATRAIGYGRLVERPADFPEVFVLPSPSGAARSYWNIAPWQQLADWIADARAS